MKSGKTIKQTFLLGLLIVFFALQLFAQNEERTRPRIKDFGLSLKRKKDKQNDKTPKEADAEAIKINTDLVVNDVLILDEKGFFVKNLSKEDVIVTEDGEPQNIEVFALGDDAKIPRSIVLVIDHSFSEVPFIVSSVMSAKILIDSLNPQDRIAIVTDNVELLCDFTRDKKRLKDELESLKIRVLTRHFGKSRQYSALHATVNELFSAEDLRRIVIFQTDGDQINIKDSKFNFDEVATAVEKSHAVVYSIFPGLRYNGLSEQEKYKQSENELNSFAKRFSSRPSFDLMNKPPPPEEKDIVQHYERITRQQQILAKIPALSGGWTAYLETPMQADSIYSKILESINHRYVIGYYPKNQTKNGKRRTVKIEVRNHPEYQIEGRKTYLPDDTEN